MEVYTVQGGPSAEVVELIEAARSIALPDCYYDGNDIVVPCWSHSDAIRRMMRLRAALQRLGVEV